MTDSELMGSLSDAEALALTMWGEARNEPLEGKAAVASVVMNRFKRPERYAETIADVCLQRRQFSCWNPGPDANHTRVMAMAERVKAGIYENDADTRSFIECAYLAQGFLEGKLHSNVGDADHYLTRELWGSLNRPGWAIGEPQFKGSQVFLKVA